MLSVLFFNIYATLSVDCTYSQTKMHTMTLNDLLRHNSPYFAFFSPNSIAVQADYITVIEDIPIISIKYCLQVPVFHFSWNLTHPTAWFLCNSCWTSCQTCCSTIVWFSAILCWYRHSGSGVAVRALSAAAVAEVNDKSLLASPAHTMTSTPTHTSYTEGTPSYTTSSPSCSSEPTSEL